jgi:membrane fusion protein, multidrug efflux system
MRPMDSFNRVASRRTGRVASPRRPLVDRATMMLRTLGYSLFALRAVKMRTRKCPNCRGRCEQRPSRANHLLTQSSFGERALQATPLQGPVFRKVGVASKTPSSRLSLLSLIFLWALIAALLSGCSRANSPTVDLGIQEVLVTEVIRQDVPVVREWIGSLDGSVNADIRARVSGYVTSQNYKEGTVVHKGDLLFQIDPSTYEAAVEQAKSALAQAEANQLQTQQTEDRETKLFEQKVESQQNRDNAVQSNIAAKAEVQAQKAALRQAQLNLDFTRITAPVTGIAGIANPGIGDLVGPSDSQPLMTVSTVDPIKAYFNISEQNYLTYVKRAEQDRAPDKTPPPVEIILADGTLYPEPGKFSAADRQVDQQTGTIRLAALFPNPNNILRPGGFVRVRVTVRRIPGALLVPQRAVNELQTSYELAVVGADNKVQIRTVKAGDRVGMLWVIEDGLKPDDRVIVEGFQKVRDGQTIKPAPWTRPADILPQNP